jgi:hypothetical protein
MPEWRKIFEAEDSDFGGGSGHHGSVFGGDDGWHSIGSCRAGSAILRGNPRECPTKARLIEPSRIRTIASPPF